ncbi:hypothetical protein G7Y89_g14023 [Cudoniella acicularis]|uniref:NAD-dependent epimerase/dehydratase domain-containing protein n=1 Tax=Cudoniella acicularis TaxID=354080 RepID=A0A8H4VXN7_9HELO|nr:hypothetical protein G7Y89_g14023 [Cudoniella acicularis]
MAIPKSNSKTVLVTGINGYIASVLTDLLLSKGYTVRGTTRKSASVEALLKGPFAPFQDRVKIYEVPDMTVSGAFDEAAKGVDGIFHTASPINFSLTRYEDFVDVAVAGNETLLASALKSGPQLKAVVVTSSVIAVIDPKEDPEYTYTEKDFASVALAKAQKDKEAGLSTPGGQLYAASKTAADRTMWKFRETHKPSFAISTVNPSVVIGPPVSLVSNPSHFNETLRPIWDIFSGSTKTIGPNIGSGSFVDVRDVAYEHLWALENPSKSDGERYIACEGFGPLQAAADILRYSYKGTPIADKIPVGNPGEGYVGYNKETGEVEDVKYPTGKVRVDGSKAEKAMGFKYISFVQSVKETAKAMEPLL